MAMYCSIDKYVTMCMQGPSSVCSFHSNDDLVFGNSLFVPFRWVWLCKYQELARNQIID